MQVRSLLFGPQGVQPGPGAIDAAVAAWRAAGGTLWLDVTAPDPAALAQLARLLLLHPAALAGVLTPEHRAAVRAYQRAFTLVLPVPSVPGQREGRAGRGRPRVHTVELDLVVGQGFLLSLHAVRLPPVDAEWDRYQRAGEAAAGLGPEMALYSVCESVLASYFPLLDRLEEAHGELEHWVIQGGRPGQVLEQVLGYKRDLLALRRTLAPVRDAFASLTRRDFPYLGADTRAAFADLYDRALRLLDLEENLRDLFSGLVDAHLTVQGNRLNEIMKVLTAITTVAIPFTVITGFFGMNFAYMPWLEWRHGVWAATALMAGAAAGMALYFRRRGWW